MILLLLRGSLNNYFIGAISLLYDDDQQAQKLSDGDFNITRISHMALSNIIFGGTIDNISTKWCIRCQATRTRTLARRGHQFIMESIGVGVAGAEWRLGVKELEATLKTREMAV